MTRLVFSIFCVACLSSFAGAEEFADQRAEVLSLGKLVDSPAFIDADGFESSENIRACFLNVKSNDLTVSSKYFEIQQGDTSDPKSAATATAKDAWEKLVGKRFLKRPEFAYLENNPALPNVLIYGDSISIHYTQRVREKLNGKANVYRIFSNGQHSGAFLTKMKRMHEAMRDKRLDDPWTFDWDLIHFNVGLHDLKYLSGKKLDKENGKQVSLIETYQQNIEKIVAYLGQLSPDAKLIFATTTPVPEGADGRFAGDAEKYNAAATKVLQKHPEITINDLFTFTKPNHAKWWIKPNDVHSVSYTHLTLPTILRV